MRALPVQALPVGALLRPRAIALVGVSAKGGAGARILDSNARFGFAVPTCTKLQASPLSGAAI